MEPTTLHDSERFMPNKYLIDIGAFFLMIGPFVNIPISYFIGYYADIEELKLQWKYETLNVATTNLSTVVIVFAILGFIFIIVYFVFGISYKSSTKNNDIIINVIYFFIWNFVEPVCLQIAQFIIVYK